MRVEFAVYIKITIALIGLLAGCSGGSGSSNGGEPPDPPDITALLESDCPTDLCSASVVTDPSSVPGNDLRHQWIARHSLSSSEYQDAHDTWTSVGFRPLDIIGYIENGNQRFAAVWEKVTGPDWVVHHNLNSSEYQTEFDRLNDEGFQPVRVSGYTGTDGNARFAAIWENSANSLWRARHNLTSDEYQTEIDNGIADGYKVVQVSGYTDRGQTRFAAIWQLDNGGDWVARHNMSSAQYEQEFDTWIANGYTLTHVDSYVRAGSPHYEAIWQVTESTDQLVRHEMITQNYQSELDNQIFAGRHPARITAFSYDDTPYFTAIWQGSGLSSTDQRYIDNTVNDVMDRYDIPGLSIALAINERLVFAKGYGYANRNTRWRTSPKQLFRIASASKPITAVGIMSLVEDGQLSLTDKVFGPDGILDYEIQACTDTKCLEDITVQHLLEHSAGAWGNSRNDPMFMLNNFNHDELIEWTLANQPLTSEPGTVFDYSNFGFFLLGRVIEATTGTDYETYMRGLLQRAAIADMHIAGNLQSDRRSNEVNYYPGTTYPTDPYRMNVERMDAHGGWISSAVDLARFCVANDKQNGKSDLLNANSMTTMLSRSSASGAGNYAKGWLVNGDVWWHNGRFPGGTSVLVKWGEYCWAVLANTTERGLGLAMDDLPKKILWGPDKNPSTGGGVQQWPAYDLF